MSEQFFFSQLVSFVILDNFLGDLNRKASDWIWDIVFRSVSDFYVNGILIWENIFAQVFFVFERPFSRCEMEFVFLRDSGEMFPAETIR